MRHYYLSISKTTFYVVFTQSLKEDLLHDVGPGKAREVAESIGAVDDWVSRWDFCIAQHKVAICMGRVLLMRHFK